MPTAYAGWTCTRTPTPLRTPHGPAGSEPRASGCAGPSTCSSAPRRVLVENLVLATDDEEREAALAAMLPLQRDDFARILTEMDGLPVTIRLIDPPLHEFLPDLTKLSVEVASRTNVAGRDPARHRLLAAVRAAHEQNPMLGLRGVRLGLVVPGLVAMQARAILEAAADRLEAGGDPRPEIMVPLVSTARRARPTAAGPGRRCRGSRVHARLRRTPPRRHDDRSTPRCPDG